MDAMMEAVRGAPTDASRGDKADAEAPCMGDADRDDVHRRQEALDGRERATARDADDRDYDYSPAIRDGALHPVDPAGRCRDARDDCCPAGHSRGGSHYCPVGCPDYPGDWGVRYDCPRYCYREWWDGCCCPDATDGRGDCRRWGYWDAPHGSLPKGGYGFPTVRATERADSAPRQEV